MTSERKQDMPRSVATHLMFEGHAEEAMNLYASVFDNFKIGHVERYAAGEQGREGTVKLAEFTFADQRFLCIDSPIKHNFTFTPSVSIFVECSDDAEQQRAYAKLSDSGTVLMPLDNYGFSKRFGWVSDRFGVSWQLNLAD
jgi:predicted 3-demethylubiquinone-9 3-methyltransferase (glyoxalase superfamily)